MKKTRAQNLLKRFQGRDPQGRGEIDIDVKGGLVFLGLSDGVLYQSDKHGGKLISYIHKFTKPYPAMYCNIRGDTLVIHGRFKINKRGICG
jgi:hypothetical protein